MWRMRRVQFVCMTHGKFLQTSSFCIMHTLVHTFISCCASQCIKVLFFHKGIFPFLSAFIFILFQNLFKLILQVSSNLFFKVLKFLSEKGHYLIFMSTDPLMWFPSYIVRFLSLNSILAISLRMRVPRNGNKDKRCSKKK